MRQHNAVDQAHICAVNNFCSVISHEDCSALAKKTGEPMYGSPSQCCRFSACLAEFRTWKAVEALIWFRAAPSMHTSEHNAHDIPLTCITQSMRSSAIVK